MPTAIDIHTDAAWSSRQPLPSAIEHLGLDFARCVAFDDLRVQILASRSDLGLV